MYDKAVEDHPNKTTTKTKNPKEKSQQTTLKSSNRHQSINQNQFEPFNQAASRKLPMPKVPDNDSKQLAGVRLTKTSSVANKMSVVPSPVTESVLNSTKLGENTLSFTEKDSIEATQQNRFLDITFNVEKKDFRVDQKTKPTFPEKKLSSTEITYPQQVESANVPFGTKFPTTSTEKTKTQFVVRTFSTEKIATELFSKTSTTSIKVDIKQKNRRRRRKKKTVFHKIGKLFRKISPF